MVKKISIRKIKKRKKGKYSTTAFKKRLCRAIEGSGGVTKVIAERLGMKYMATWKMLQKAPEKFHEQITHEREFVADLAEQTVMEMMVQRLDFGTASRTAMQVLRSKKYKKRGYGEGNKLTIEGGKKPIKVQNENVLPMSDLNLPIELRKQILEAVKKKEAEEKEKE